MGLEPRPSATPKATGGESSEALRCSSGASVKLQRNTALQAIDEFCRTHSGTRLAAGSSTKRLDGLPVYSRCRRGGGDEEDQCSTSVSVSIKPDASGCGFVINDGSGSNEANQRNCVRILKRTIDECNAGTSSTDLYIEQYGTVTDSCAEWALKFSGSSR